MTQDEFHKALTAIREACGLNLKEQIAVLDAVADEIYSEVDKIEATTGVEYGLDELLGETK